MCSRHARALLTTLLLFPAATFAHTGTGHSGFIVGFAHPFGGIDHLLAMLAVGVLAMRFTGWQRWSLPISFLAAMMLGGLLGARHVSLPFVEGFIALSLVVFGCAILLARAPRYALAVLATSSFAIFHGHAHGAEMGAVAPMIYGFGFLLATASLHGAGMWLTSKVSTTPDRAPLPIRVAGSVVAAAGLALIAIG